MYTSNVHTKRGVVPLLDRGADKLVRLGGRWRGRSLTLGVSLEGVYLSLLSVESDLSMLMNNNEYVDDIKYYYTFPFRVSPAGPGRWTLFKHSREFVFNTFLFSLRILFFI